MARSFITKEARAARHLVESAVRGRRRNWTAGDEQARAARHLVESAVRGRRLNWTFGDKQARAVRDLVGSAVRGRRRNWTSGAGESSTAWGVPFHRPRPRAAGGAWYGDRATA